MDLTHLHGLFPNPSSSSSLNRDDACRTVSAMFLQLVCPRSLLQHEQQICKSSVYHDGLEFWSTWPGSPLEHGWEADPRRVLRGDSLPLEINQKCQINSVEYHIPFKQKPRVDLGTPKCFAAWRAEYCGSLFDFVPDAWIAAIASWMRSSCDWVRISWGMETPGSGGKEDAAILQGCMGATCIFTEWPLLTYILPKSHTTRFEMKMHATLACTKYVTWGHEVLGVGENT